MQGETLRSCHGYRHAGCREPCRKTTRTLKFKGYEELHVYMYITCVCMRVSCMNIHMCTLYIHVIRSCATRMFKLWGRCRQRNLREQARNVIGRFAWGSSQDTFCIIGMPVLFHPVPGTYLNIDFDEPGVETAEMWF